MSNVTVQLDEVLQEMDPLGQALFDAAQCRALSKKQGELIDQLQARVAELEKPPEVVDAA